MCQAANIGDSMMPSKLFGGSAARMGKKPSRIPNTTKQCGRVCKPLGSLQMKWKVSQNSRKRAEGVLVITTGREDFSQRCLTRLWAGLHYNRNMPNRVL